MVHDRFYADEIYSSRPRSRPIFVDENTGYYTRGIVQKYILAWNLTLIDHHRHHHHYSHNSYYHHHKLLWFQSIGHGIRAAMVRRSRPSIWRRSDNNDDVAGGGSTRRRRRRRLRVADSQRRLRPERGATACGRSVTVWFELGSNHGDTQLDPPRTPTTVRYCLLFTNQRSDFTSLNFA